MRLSPGSLRRLHAVEEFREALQLLPVRRAGKLQRATLPVLGEWSKNHPEARKVSPATVNKLPGGVQAVVVLAPPSMGIGG